MPRAAPRPCTYPGCGALVHGASRCDKHKHQLTGRFGDRHRGSRQSRGYGSEWDKTRAFVLARDHGICQQCLRDEGLMHRGTEVDHRVNKAAWRRQYGSLDGVDAPANMQCICVEAHRAKTQAEAREGRG